MDVSRAFQTLQELSETVRATALGLPAQVDVRPHWTGIGFSLCGRRFVAPMSEIIEMLEVPPFTNLPGVKDWVKGLANVRGSLLPIVDLAQFFGERLTGARRSQRVLVVGDGDSANGLLVDGIYGMQHFPTDNYQTELADVGVESLLPYLSGGFQDDAGVEWIAISLQSIISSDQFGQAAA